jgi:hypothetical protein
MLPLSFYNPEQDGIHALLMKTRRGEGARASAGKQMLVEHITSKYLLTTLSRAFHKFRGI